MKASKLLKSFTSYCEGNPELRFWQALCGWSKAKAIYYLADECPSEVDDMIQFYNSECEIGKEIDLVDTFYWEDKNK